MWQTQRTRLIRCKYDAKAVIYFNAPQLAAGYSVILQKNAVIPWEGYVPAGRSKEEKMLYFMEYVPEGKTEDRRTEHIIGRQLLEYGLKEEYKRAYEVGYMKGGKPYLPEASHIYFNISHTKGLVVCAISDREIGIDAEYMRDFRESLIQRVCSDAEKKYIFQGQDMGDKEAAICRERFTRIWTLKESYIKAIGKGLSFPLREIEFFIKEKKERTVSVTASIPGWNYRQFILQGKYVVSVCERAGN